MSRAPKPIRLAAAEPSTLSDGVAWVRRRLQLLAKDSHAAVGNDAPPLPAKLLLLGERLGLTSDELPIVLLLAAAAVDTTIPLLCAAANGSAQRAWPTFELALRLFPGTGWSVLTAAGGLRWWRLIEIHQAGSEPLLSAALRLDERVVDLLMGSEAPDDRVAALVAPVRGAATAPPPRLASAIERIAESGGPVILLAGADQAAKPEVATRAAAAWGLALWRLPTAALKTIEGDATGFVRLLLRELKLCQAGLYVDTTSIEAADAAPLQQLLERLEGATVFLAARGMLPGIMPNLHIEIERPGADEQRRAWEEALPGARQGLTARIAGQFRLGSETIRKIGAAAVTHPKLDVWQAAREAARPDVGGLATRIETRAGWGDLVLPEAQLALLHELASQVVHQWQVYEDWGFGRKLTLGLGISALFAGESGTGKTMAAGVVANAAGLDLYRIDLASVVSKYVGETEKNLRRVFDAFEDGGAILFFDEADALFGKRSEVKDSHDRYANIEINYLLQRLESYRGLAILATNRRTALDPAFLRRLRFIVTFPFPGAEERQKIWEQAFPGGLGAGLDYPRLARLGLSGGNIQTVVLNAAFRAAGEGRTIAMEHVLGAARVEMQKLDIPFSETDFRIIPELWRRA